MLLHRVLFFANYGRYCIYIGVNHKTILLNEGSARYMNFIGWMARAFEEKEDDIQHLPKLSLHILRVASSTLMMVDVLK